MPTKKSLLTHKWHFQVILSNFIQPIIQKRQVKWKISSLTEIFSVITNLKLGVFIITQQRNKQMHMYIFNTSRKNKSKKINLFYLTFYSGMLQAMGSQSNTTEQLNWTEPLPTFCNFQLIWYYVIIYSPTSDRGSQRQYINNW